MLASLSGSLALLLGLAVMLLPLLGPELSRPRDSAWGALVLLLGLTLVTSADRLSGAPMLAVLCGGLLIGRLGGEVMQLRWSQLTPEEQQGLLSRERWQRSLSELSVSVGSLVGRLTMIGAALGSSLAGLSAALQRGRGRPGSAGSGKRWVRPEPEAPGVTETVGAAETVHETVHETVSETVNETVTVSSFAEIEALISTAAEAAATATAAPEPTERPAQHSEAG